MQHSIIPALPQNKKPNILRRKQNEEPINEFIAENMLNNNDNEANGKPRKDKSSRSIRKIKLDSYISDKSKNLTENINIERTKIVTALESGALGEYSILIGEGNDQRHFWLCPIAECNKLFLDRSVLHLHMLSHFNLSSFKCDIEGCPEEFICKDKLTDHKTETHRNNNTKKIVDDALSSVGVTDEQIKQVTLEDASTRWLCPYSGCESNFKTKYLIKNHLLMHYNLRPFECNFGNCVWKFRSLNKLKCHQTVHGERGNGPYLCTHSGCKKTFSTRYNLSAHKRLHEKFDDVTGLCPVKECTKEFEYHADLLTHLKDDHEGNDAMHECKLCVKKFWWKSSLEKHLGTDDHTPKELVCTWEGCGRRFAIPSRLKYHLRSHTGDKPYKCTFPSCNWAFHSSGKLRRHARIHSGSKGRQYVCEACGRAFLRSEHLQEHLLRHLPYRNYSCDYPGCDQKFMNKSSIYVHKKRDHVLNEISCIVEIDKSITDISQIKLIDDDSLSLRCARTHVPWDLDTLRETHTSHDVNILQHKISCDEKQGNPLVCGGLGLEGDNLSVGAGLTLELDGSEVSSLTAELNTDLLGSSNDHINSLLLQEELSDAILYAPEEEAALQVMLLSEDPAP